MGWRELRARHQAEAEAGGRPERRATAPLVQPGTVPHPEPVTAAASCFAPSNEAPQPAPAPVVDDPTELDRLTAAGPWGEGWEARYARVHGSLPEHGTLAAGRLPRVSVQALALMDAPHIEARADAAAARVYQLEAAGVGDRLPEYKGLRAELRWVARHRPEALALRGMTAELTTAAGLVAEITDAEGRPIARRELAWPKAPAVKLARDEEWL